MNRKMSESFRIQWVSEAGKCDVPVGMYGWYDKRDESKGWWWNGKMVVK